MEIQVAKLLDSSVAKFRVAGDASAATSASTGTVELSSAAVKIINHDNVAKFKFPGV